MKIKNGGQNRKEKKTLFPTKKGLFITKKKDLSSFEPKHNPGRVVSSLFS